MRAERTGTGRGGARPSAFRSAFPGTALLALPPLALLLFFLIAPLARVLQEGGLAPGVWTDPYFQGRLVWTATQAGLSTLAATAVGVPLAYLLARYAVPFGGALLRALLLPFVTPTLVAAMGLAALVGPRGLLGVDLTDTAWIVILGNLFFNLPLMIRLAHAGFARVPRDLAPAARTLGSGALRAALTVSLPLALPGVLAGVVLVFLYSFLTFGVPLLLGGPQHATLEVEIYTLTAYQLALGEASALIGVQLLITLLATLVYLRLVRAATAGVPARALERPRGTAAVALGALLTVTVVLCFGPLVAVAVRSVLGDDGFTLAFWRGITDPGGEAPVWPMLRNTVSFALMGTGAALLLGGLHALATWRSRSRTLDLLSLLPLMVSPVSLAVGYLLLYPALRAGLPLLIAAYTLLATPLVTRSVLPALRALPLTLLGAARVLGSTRLRAWRTVALPLVLPAVRGGAALALATILGEFAATLVLTRPEWVTLSIGVAERLGRPGEQNLGEASALATLLLGLALAGFSLLDGGRGEVA